VDLGCSAKLADIVRLYVDPPAHAAVLSLGENSQIQALDRINPRLPIKPGRCQMRTRLQAPWRRYPLFAAFGVLDGTGTGWYAAPPPHRVHPLTQWGCARGLGRQVDASGTQRL
jgi:hypothetical protein